MTQFPTLPSPNAIKVRIRILVYEFRGANILSRTIGNYVLVETTGNEGGADSWKKTINKMRRPRIHPEDGQHFKFREKGRSN